MQEAGTKPIESAIVIVLTTSAHISVRSHKDCGYTAMLKGIPNKDAGVLNGMIAGVAMIGDGRKSLELLNKMGLKLELEHNTCIVDLLARAGMVEEAEKFIEDKMGGLGRGDANAWGALLAADNRFVGLAAAAVWRVKVQIKSTCSGPRRRQTRSEFVVLGSGLHKTSDGYEIARNTGQTLGYGTIMNDEQ
ncbi:hypothetical protein ACFX11_017826 [Malus domestica]